MAVMSTLERARCLAQAMREAAWPDLTKPQLLAAVNAADQWVEDNQTSYNQALPAAFRNTATLTQKALLLCLVIMRRVGRLRAEEDDV